MKLESLSDRRIGMKVTKGVKENVAVETDPMNKMNHAVVARSAAKDERLLARRQLSVGRRRSISTTIRC